MQDQTPIAIRALVTATALVVLALTLRPLAVQPPQLPAVSADERSHAQALLKAGRDALARGDYTVARDETLRALAIFDRLGAATGVGDSQALLARIVDLLGDRNAARSYAEQAIATFERVQDWRGRAVATLRLLEIPNVEIAAAERNALLERAVQDARTAGEKTLEGNALHSWGDQRFAVGDYERAFELLTRAIAVLEHTDQRVRLGTVYNSLGRLYRAHGQLSAALDSQLKALAIHEAAGAPFERLQSINAVAVTYEALGDLARARPYYARALAGAEQSAAPRIQDFLRANFAGLLIAEGDYARAVPLLEQVIARGQDPYLAVRHVNLSIAFRRLGRQHEALAAAERAVELCGSNAADCILALRTRAEARVASGDHRAALADIESATARIEEARTRLVPADFFKQRYHQSRTAIYTLAITLQLAQGQDRAALETAELARSRAFLDLLASRDVAAPPASGAATGPALVPSPAAAPPATANDLFAAAARLRSTLLAYWVADEEIFIWVVAPDGALRSARVPVLRAKLTDLIRATAPTATAGSAAPGAAGISALTTRRDVRPAFDPARAKVWRQLYDLLIAPVRHALPRDVGASITIVSHGPLTNVAFAALQDARGRYLLEDFTLHAVPAGGVLAFTATRRHASARTGSALVVADPELPARAKFERPLRRLPGARAEARAIAGLLPPARITMLQGADAGEPRVRSAAIDKSFIHFATHAIVRDDDPLASFLAVGPTTAGEWADGVLTAGEIYGLDLDADLIVLSACRSGGGAVTGDGIATFARAFIYAGTPSLIVSVWDVADEPTNRLLPEFYREWLTGTSKARALRIAQLRVLRDLRAGRIRITTPLAPIVLPEDPAFWAGFTLIGEPN